MKHTVRCVTVLALTTVGPGLGVAAAGAEPSPSARAFVQAIYAHYPAPADGKPMFDPTGKQAVQVFTPEIIARLRDDKRRAGGEVGALDGDPFCACQDDGGMTFQVASVNLTGPAAAEAVVVERIPTMKPVKIRLRLLRLKAGWRVADIASPDMSSLRDLLAPPKRASGQALH